MRWTILKSEAIEYLESIKNKKWVANYSPQSKPLIEKTLKEKKLQELKRWTKVFRKREALLERLGKSTD